MADVQLNLQGRRKHLVVGGSIKFEGTFLIKKGASGVPVYFAHRHSNMRNFISLSKTGRNFWGGVGGCDTPPPPMSDWQGNWLFLQGKMPTNWSRCNEQKYFSGFENHIYCIHKHFVQPRT